MGNRRKDRMTPYEVMRRGAPPPVKPRVRDDQVEVSESQGPPETQSSTEEFAQQSTPTPQADVEAAAVEPADPPAEIAPSQPVEEQPAPQPAAAATPPEPATSPAPEPAPAAEPARPGNIPGSASPGPIVLRIPQGYAVMLGIALLGVIVLAYWVGYQRGDRDRLNMIRQEQAAALAAQERMFIPGGSEATEMDSANTQTAGVNRPSQTSQSNGTKRVASKNYFVLVHYHRDEADRLVAFLRANGVEAEAISSNNGRLFKVLALKGFSADQINSDQRKQYEQTLRRLGRSWEKTRAGAGDLSDMYLERYNGEQTE